MPDLCLEAHDRRSEGVFAWDLDIDCEGAAFVWCVRRPVELTAEMCEVIAVTSRLDNDLGELVVLDVGNLLGDTSGSVGGSHAVDRCSGGRWRGRGARNKVRNRQRVVVNLRSCGQPEASQAPIAAGSVSLGGDSELRSSEAQQLIAYRSGSTYSTREGKFIV